MEKAQRAELLRARFLAKGGVPFPPTGKPRKRIQPGSGKPWNMAWQEQGQREDRRPDWIEEPDETPKPTPQIKHNQGESALTKIARKLPAKLPRVLFDL